MGFSAHQVQGWPDPHTHTHAIVCEITVLLAGNLPYTRSYAVIVYGTRSWPNLHECQVGQI